jgi:hypothetical protein
MELDGLRRVKRGNGKRLGDTCIVGFLPSRLVPHSSSLSSYLVEDSFIE